MVKKVTNNCLHLTHRISQSVHGLGGTMNTKNIQILSLIIIYEPESCDKVLNVLGSSLHCVLHFIYIIEL